MTRKLFALFAAVSLLTMAVLFAACEQSMLRPSDDDGGDSGLEVGIRRLYFDHSLLGATAGSARPLRLELTRFPPHNTMPHDAVRWSSSCYDGNGNPTIASIDDNGNIIIVLDYLDVHELPRTATLRAEYIHDTSVFVEATLMVFPYYERSRHQTFPPSIWTGNTTQVNPGPALDAILNRFTTINEAGDLHLGDGIFLLLGTGDAGAAEREGDEGQGVFIINPEDPYEFGIIPNGNPRALGSTHNGALTFEPGTPNMVPREGHLRTSGSGMRALQVLGLHRPFEITVRYRSNGAEPRWVDIRFGDTSGVRVEGPISPGNAAGDGRVVRYRWDYDEHGNPRADFVPITFIEVIGGMQIFDVEIVYLGDES